MGNQLRFLGTGGDAVLVGKQIRASGGIILQLEGNQFHLDPGPGALVQAHAHNINLREHIAVLVSQNTIVHANDVNALVYGMTHGGLDRFGVIVCSGKLRQVDNPGLGLLFEATEQYVEKVIRLDEINRISINHITIEPIQHKREETGALGYRFSTMNNSLAYVSDTQYFDGLAQACGKSNIMVVWCRHPSGVTEKGTLNTDDVAALVAKVKPKLCYLTGFGVKMLDADPLSQGRLIQKQSGVQVMIAKDGLDVDLDLYADKQKQQRIRSYTKR